MIFSEDFFHFLFRQWWNDNTWMIVGQNASQPLKVTIPPINLLMKLRQIDLKRNKIPTEELALIFPKTDDIQLNRSKRKLVNLLDTLSGFHVELHVSVINRHAIHLGLT